MTIDEMRERKRELGLTNRDIAAKAGVPEGTVRKIFSGETTAPRRATVEALVKALEKRPEAESIRLPFGAYNPPDPNVLTASMVHESPIQYGTGARRKFTVSDYRALPDSVRVELIDGEYFRMEAPTTLHQAISMALSVRMAGYVDVHDEASLVFTAPVDVQLNEDEYTMVQPDLIVLCDRSRLQPWGIYGAPDMVVEILSKSSKKKDLTLKLDLYTKAGVKEYWLIDPDGKRVLVYADLQNAELPKIYGFDAKIPVHIWQDDCRIDFAKIYERIRKQLPYLQK